jgi:acetyltransferase-like isoleucine patch superfamily enzyme
MIIVKAIIKYIINILALFVSVFIRYEIILSVDYFFKRVVWYAVRKKFSHIGKGSYIEWPFLLKGFESVHIGDNFSALSYFRMEAYNRYLDQTFKPMIRIGNNVAFNNDCHIGCINQIDIGDNVLVASRVYITDHFHGDASGTDLTLIPAKRQLLSKGPVIIGENVWIGEGVTILPNVTIGHNAIIAANSVVNGDVPPNAVVAGVPAKIIRLIR